MKKVILLTLGFDERFAYRAILRHDVKEGDKIFLISGRTNDKVIKAYRMVEEFLIKSFGDEIDLELIEVDPSNAIESIGKIIKVISPYRERRIIVNLSGGMRSIIVSTLLAVLFTHIRNIEVEIELENLSGIVEFPHQLLELVSKRVTSTGLAILRNVEEGHSNIRELARITGKDESTIRKRVQELKTAGLVKVLKRKPIMLEITDLGELILRVGF